MDILILALAVATLIAFLNAQQQKRRIALLSQHLGKYQIETLMETITQGYLRALGEDEPGRREQIWTFLASAENAITSQFNRFAHDVAELEAKATRVNLRAFALPWAMLPTGASFDFREAIRIHAQGIADAVANREQRSPRDKAFTLSAELFLMQHTCHWFCRSRTTASARLLRRHQTGHEQVLAAVAPHTRQAYRALTGV